MRLTDLSIRKLPLPPKGQKTYFEGGFGVRVSQGGLKTFVVMHGKRRKLTKLGRYPDLALKDARRLAHRVLDTPPVIPLKKPEDAISAFLEHVERNNKPRTHKDYKRLLKRFQTSFDRPTIITTLKAFRNTPGELSHITTAFQVFLNWCVNNGYLEQNPIVGLKNQGRIKKRDRILSDDELKAIWSALGDDRFENIVRILMLTGLRRGEAQHIVVDNDTASIPAEHTKNGREHIFPLGTLSKQYVTPITFGGWGKSKNVWMTLVVCRTGRFTISDEHLHQTTPDWVHPSTLLNDCSIMCPVHWYGLRQRHCAAVFELWCCPRRQITNPNPHDMIDDILTEIQALRMQAGEEELTVDEVLDFLEQAIFEL